jgi:hypothetical protein
MGGGHGYAFCCEICDDSDPKWRLERVGDVATSWACDEHLPIVCDRLQRDFEVTRLTVWNAQKMREWAEIGQKLREIKT